MDTQLIKTLKSRHATRAMLNEALPEEFVSEMKEAARLTPSCFNNQPWRYLFLQSREALDKVKEILAPGNFQWASKAPLIVIGYSREENDCLMKDGRAYHQFDLGMATMNILLAATERGLVARPMAGFNPDKTREMFNLDAKDKPLVVIAIGKFSSDDAHVPDYAKGAEGKPRERKPVDEIIKVL
jgi:nitroreductase